MSIYSDKPSLLQRQQEMKRRIQIRELKRQIGKDFSKIRKGKRRSKKLFST